MPRNLISIEPREIDEGTGVYEIAGIVTLQLGDMLDFIQKAAVDEGKAEIPEFRVLLEQLTSLQHEGRMTFNPLCSAASTIFGVGRKRMQRILWNLYYNVQNRRRAWAYNIALKEIKTEKYGRALPRCFFNPFATTTNSVYRTGDLFGDSPIPSWIWDVVEWMSSVVKPRNNKQKQQAVSPDHSALDVWFRTAVADILTSFPNSGHSSEMWRALDTMGLHFSSELKTAIMKQLKGQAFGFKKLLRDADWTFDQKACDDARKRWADNWADRFVEYLNSTQKGIVKYGDNMDHCLNLESSLSNMEHWIRLNTRYCALLEGESLHVQTSGGYSAFVQALTKSCREGWYRDIGLAFQRFGQRERALLGEGSSLSSAGTLETSVEKLDSDLKELGLTLTEPAMKMIVEGLPIESSLKCSVTDLQTRLQMIMGLQQHAFEVDPKRVSKIAVSHIKAVFSRTDHRIDRKRPYT